MSSCTPAARNSCSVSASRPSSVSIAGRSAARPRVNNEAPPDYTRVNDRPVSNRVELRDGDRIQLGNVLLRFQLREARRQKMTG